MFIIKIFFKVVNNIDNSFRILKKKLEEDSNISVVDFSDVEIPFENNKDLMEILYFYNVSLLGISEERISLCESFIGSGFFQKRNMSFEQYLNFFYSTFFSGRKSLYIFEELSFTKKENPLKNIVIPYKRENGVFYFKKLKPKYKSFIKLEQAVEKGKDLWNIEAIKEVDLYKDSFCFRFPISFEERDLLEYYSLFIFNKEVKKIDEIQQNN